MSVLSDLLLPEYSELLISIVNIDNQQFMRRIMNIRPSADADLQAEQCSQRCQGVLGVIEDFYSESFFVPKDYPVLRRHERQRAFAVVSNVTTACIASSVTEVVAVQ